MRIDEYEYVVAVRSDFLWAESGYAEQIRFSRGLDRCESHKGVVVSNDKRSDFVLAGANQSPLL